MDIAFPKVSVPTVRRDAAIWFSAYGFGWGYCAFEIASSIMCAHLGAADATPEQLMLAFELGKHAIVRAIESKNVRATGERIALRSRDL
jgi:D-arabinose 1-dehydrogenase-like Zn-dependent alcohol dehydrogenase